jgi:hypothetical protein
MNAGKWTHTKTVIGKGQSREWMEEGRGDY